MLIKKTIFLILSIFIALTALSQSGKISGKVIAASSNPLPGATVLLIEKNKSTATDQAGSFSFTKIDSGTYSIRCSYLGYETKEVGEIQIKPGEVFNLTITLSVKTKSQNEVVIKSTRVSARRETVASMLNVQKNSASVSDFITAQQITKTPDRSTSDVIKRVSGASIQDDRFAIIRGLNDRYNAAFLNGAPLPSSESDRKAFAFDIFPSSILDNLIIYKTATPDKTGEFAGGIIDLTTKSILPKSFTNISLGASYNTLLTGNPRFFSENKGKTDWLGLDDGTRGLPNGLPSTKQIKALTALKKADLAKSFGNYKWGINQKDALPNYSLQVSKGFNIERNDKEFLGALVALNYSRNFTFTESQRYSYDFDMTNPVYVSPEKRNDYKDSVYNDEVVVSALANIGIKLNAKNSLSLKNNLSINTDNKLIKRIGTPDFTSDSTSYVKDAVRWYTSNQIFSSQLSGEHTAGPFKTKINWLASYSKVNRKIPSLTRTSYSGFYPDMVNVFGIFATPPNQTAGSGTIFTTNSNEKIKSIKADISQGYTFFNEKENYIKLGGGYQYRDRLFDSRILGFATYSGSGSFDFSLLTLPENKIFLPEHLGKMANGKFGFQIEDGTLSNSDYTASSAMAHAYILSDQRFFKKIRLIYGVRMESFNQKLNSIKNLIDTVRLNTKVTDYLPSVNLVYALTKKMNVRLSYSETINRPEFRELAPFLFYDYVSGYTFEGQDNLQRAKIKNYDFRYEFYPGRAQVFSASAFQKEFTNPIEIIQIPNTTGQTIYVNSNSGKVYGVEAEFRSLLSTLLFSKKEDGFLSRITLAANAAYMKSSVKLGSLFGFAADKLVTERALLGQSPYIVNGSLSYVDDTLGISITGSVNRIGDRIMIGGTYNSADIYEKARTIVDVQATKTLLKNKLELKITAKDLLSQNMKFYFDYDRSKSLTENDRLFAISKMPKVINFSVAYKF